MGVFSAARPKPTQRPTQATEDIISDAAMETPTVSAPQGEHITSYDTASIQKFMGMEPELPPLPSDGAATESTTAPPPHVDGATASDTINAAADAEDATADTSDTRKWYERWFGGKDADGPAQMEGNAEIDDEMYRVTAEAATEVTEQILTRVIGRLHDRPASDYLADPKQKTGVAHAWELYQRSKKISLSPLQYLLFKITIVWGIDLVLGIFVWVSRLGIYGWHWPWSDSWKRPSQKTVRPTMKPAMAQSMEQPYQEPINTAEMQPTPQPAPTPIPQPIPQGAPKPTPQPTPQPDQLPNYKKCLQTSRLFRTSEGYPQAKHKTGQSFPQFVDAFADRAAWMAYSNKNALYGQGGKQGMTSKPEAAE
jgi:hypothetical protein